MKSASKATLWLVVLLLLGTTGLPLTAQNVISAQAGLVNYTEGPALLNGQETRPARGVFPQMKAQDTLRTTRGRAELLGRQRAAGVQQPPVHHGVVPKELRDDIHAGHPTRRPHLVARAAPTAAAGGQ